MTSILCPTGHRHALPVLEGTCWSDAGEPRDVSVTRREFEVASLLLRYGYGNQEIARKLYISEDTVKTHLKNLLKRTGATNRTELVVAVHRSRIRLIPAAVEYGHAKGVRWSASKEPIPL